eukprot:5033943-Prymnesium_polylepis.1
MPARCDRGHETRGAQPDERRDAVCYHRRRNRKTQRSPKRRASGRFPVRHAARALLYPPAPAPRARAHCVAEEAWPVRACKKG